MVVRDTQAALTQLGRRLARAVFAAHRRRRRQQRQDHGQGNDRGHPRARGQRRSRRAAISTTTSACRSRCTGSMPTHRYAVIEIGANRAGEVADLVELARPTVGLITNAGAEHLEGFGSIEGVARAEGEMVAGLDACRHRGDQCRRRLRGPVARHDARRASSTFGVANAARTFRRTTCTPSIDADRLRHAFHAACAGRRDAHRAAPGGRAQRAERVVRRRGGLRRRRLARRRARRPCHNAPGSWPIAVQNRAEWCLDRRRLLQRQSQLDEGRDRGAGERRRAALAGHGRHGRARRLRRRTVMARSAASRAITASTACSPPASCRRSRSRPSVRAANGSRTPRRWRARSMPSSRARCACW